jgi:hypothetical protein
VQKIVIDEKISIWQKIEVTFSDGVDLSSKEKIEEALNTADIWNISVIEPYYSTEQHLEYDIPELTEVEYVGD